MEKFNVINTLGIDKDEAFHLALRAETERNFSPTINGVTVGLSTGTTGNRGIFLADENEKAMWVGAILDRVIGFSLRPRKVAFFLRANSNLYEAVGSRLIQFRFFDLLKEVDTNLMDLQKLKPDILVAQPSMLNLIADAIQERKLVISPRKIISVAEVLSPEDKQKFERIFQQKIHQVYQCTEGFLAATCKFGNLHFNEDFLIVEKNYLDDDRTRFYPVITDLSRRSQPVVRYELNDVITELAHCPCQSKTLSIQQIEGRSEDIFVFTDFAGKRVLLFPDFLSRCIVFADETISDYVLIQQSETLLSLFVKGSETSFERAKEAILNVLHQKKINAVVVEQLVASPHKLGTKKRRIINQYEKTS